ncbi:hypothetical protein [Amycolatopsis sp. NPDC051061]|uniref:hypothetical protein n=1 Tax=Amycolatopsis sp. NPDC051061 TaxID=3155042 RepID=UPI003424992C
MSQPSHCHRTRSAGRTSGQRFGATPEPDAFLSGFGDRQDGRSCARQPVAAEPGEEPLGGGLRDERGLVDPSQRVLHLSVAILVLPVPGVDFEYHDVQAEPAYRSSS